VCAYTAQHSGCAARYASVTDRLGACMNQLSLVTRRITPKMDIQPEANDQQDDARSDDSHIGDFAVATNLVLDTRHAHAASIGILDSEVVHPGTLNIDSI